MRRSSYGANARDNERVRHEGRDQRHDGNPVKSACPRPTAGRGYEALCPAHDHRPSADLKRAEGLVEGGKVKAPLPTGLDAEHQKKLDELKAKSGKEFDRAYDQMQLQAHEEAVALFSDYARNGDNPDLKAWAAKTLPHLREHLEMAKKLS